MARHVGNPERFEMRKGDLEIVDEVVLPGCAGHRQRQESEQRLAEAQFPLQFVINRSLSYTATSRLPAARRSVSRTVNETRARTGARHS